MPSSFHSLILIACMVSLAACHSGANTTAEATAIPDSLRFEFKETIATGSDTGMVSLVGKRKMGIAEVLAQHWELGDMEDVAGIDWVLDDDNKRQFPELILFDDSTAVQDPRSHLFTGTWNAGVVNRKIVLHLHSKKQGDRNYLIKDISSTRLMLGKPGALNPKDSVYIVLTSDGLIHANKHNDPFYPDNLWWMQRPAKPETDSAIHARVKACIKFYALFYRDHLKRGKNEMSYLGLPAIFEWYRRGIGLPDRDAISDSWIACFYNKKEAMKGWDILHDLIVNYEFDWPEHAPNWAYETHSVLEQMYHKAN